MSIPFKLLNLHPFSKRHVLTKLKAFLKQDLLIQMKLCTAYICAIFASRRKALLADVTLCKYRVSQKIVLCLSGCCRGAADSIISVFTKLHRSGFNLAFEILYESI